jgi:hypothetical protein
MVPSLRGNFSHMLTRRITLVGHLEDRRTVHTAGYPLDLEKLLPPPDVLLLIDKGRDGCMLFRYTAHGEFAGDTPHDTAAQAEATARLEYGDAILAWIEVPHHVEDAHAFAVRYAAEQLNERE